MQTALQANAATSACPCCQGIARDSPFRANVPRFRGTSAQSRRADGQGIGELHLRFVAQRRPPLREPRLPGKLLTGRPEGRHGRLRREAQGELREPLTPGIAKSAWIAGGPQETLAYPGTLANCRLVQKIADFPRFRVLRDAHGLQQRVTPDRQGRRCTRTVRDSCLQTLLETPGSSARPETGSLQLRRCRQAASPRSPAPAPQSPRAPPCAAAPAV